MQNRSRTQNQNSTQVATNPLGPPRKTWTDDKASNSSNLSPQTEHIKYDLV